jgi:hypothetical protein
MLSRETDAIYYENHEKYINGICGHNAEFHCVKPGDTYSSNQSALRG